MKPGFMLRGPSDAASEQLLEKQLAELERMVCQLKAETMDLRLLKGKCQIHLQMFKKDYETLHTLYESMKSSLHALSHPSQGVRAANPVDRPRETELTPTSSLSHADLLWEIESPDPFYDASHVSLCYALKTTSVLCSVEFDSTGERFAFADGRTVFLINSEDGSLLASFQIPHILESNEIHTRALRFSPDDQFIAISGPNTTVHVFSVRDKKVVAKLDRHKKTVSALLFLRDQNWLLSGGHDGVICIWEVGTWRLVRELRHTTPDEKEDMINALTEAHDRSFVAVGFMNGSVGIYEPTFQQPMGKFNAHNDYLLGVAAAHKIPMIATCSRDKTVKLWSLRGVASRKHTLEGHTNCVISAAFSPDDSIVLSGSKDETIRAWDQKTGDPLFTISARQNTLFEIDHHPSQNKFVSCSGDGIVCLWKYDAKR